MMSRAESATAVSSVCWAKNTSAVSMMANIMATKGSSISPNSTAEEPSARRLRLGLRRRGGRLRDGLGEILRGVAKRDAALAIGRAAIGLAIDAAVDDHNRILRADHLDAAFRQYGAGAIERDKVGGSIS